MTRLSDQFQELTAKLPPSELQSVVAARERYEADVRADRQPVIEDHLRAARGNARAAMLCELIAIDWEMRAARGEQPTLQDYLDRFPNDAEGLQAVFGELETKRAPSEYDASPASPRDQTELATARGLAVSAGPDPTTDGSEETLDGDATTECYDAPEPPLRFGRYSLVRHLGSGGFGAVYLAQDDELHRTVAIKIPRAEMFTTPERVEVFLTEARLAAKVHHPAIVSVFDVGRLDDGRPFVVMQHIEGATLADLFRKGRIPYGQLAELMATVAEGIHEAHKAFLVHRDLKPSNILIDMVGRPCVADFGLAIHETAQRLRSGEVAGTPSYMAPEQVRGETHRLDGRTDVWSLGVILYKGLTGRLPYTGGNRTQIFDEILYRDPKPPRQVNDTIPRELERICLKCLAKRMTDRYPTTLDLAADLRAWSASAERDTPVTTERMPGTEARSSTDVQVSVVPKGLRSFDLEDAEFFLALLPGPRDRNGLPDSLRFWKTRIEEQDVEKAFKVGLLYGPSGSGKSSLVKAGLLPRINQGVRKVYLESSSQSTETRLLAALRRQFSALAAIDSLNEALISLRERDILPRGEKLLIVLDQFEQWLQAHPDDRESELIRALRQCDGQRVQAFILVRDDFWMAITRFMRALEVPMIDGFNTAAVELFFPSHARKVLMDFGRAYGRVPDGEPASAEVVRFLDQAVEGLADHDGRIIPVQLSLFAEMVRDREWTPATLRELGGVQGIGVTFLEETFCGDKAAPAHRLHRSAAQAVLKSLLPNPSSELKERVRSGLELCQVSGYADRPADFAELLRILDGELRMVTPVDPEHIDPRQGDGLRQTYYQLTHDNLVPSIRLWLTRKQRETRRGRAELRLAAITTLWSDRPEPRRLPSVFEWVDILWHTSPRLWSHDERRMMRSASRRRFGELATALAILALVVTTGRIVSDRSRAASLLDQCLKVDYGHLPALLPEVERYMPQLRQGLEQTEANPAAEPRDREIATALLYRDQPTEARADFLRQRLLAAPPEEVVVIREALARWPRQETLKALWADLLADSKSEDQRLRVAGALARLDPGGPGWRAAAPTLAHALLNEDRRVIPEWSALLGPEVTVLLPHLTQTFRDGRVDAPTRLVAAETLADVLGQRGDSAGLAALIADATPETFPVLLRELAGLADQDPGVATFDQVLAEPDNPSAREAQAARHANAAVALLALGQPEKLWPRLRHSDDPRLRTLLIQRLAGLNVSPIALLDRLDREPDPVALQALLLTWAETNQGRIEPRIREKLATTAARLFLHHPHHGVHSAAELLLRRLGRDGLISQTSATAAPAPGQQWYVGPNGHTFAIVPGPIEFWMGSPPDEPWRFPTEEQQYRRIKHGLAAATNEVTHTQFFVFDPSHKQDPRFDDAPDMPADTISWYEAARYCNWLSKQAGIPESEWCYPSPVGPGMVLDPASIERIGYRLPTEAEWEYLCRSGTETSRPYGQSQELLSHYAWTWLNAGESPQPVGRLLPNEYGLFDVLGNEWEWCHDGPPPSNQRDVFLPYPIGTREKPAGEVLKSEKLLFQGADPHKYTERYARGGSYSYAPSKARSAFRYVTFIDLKHAYMGFRVVRTLPASGKIETIH